VRWESDEKEWTFSQLFSGTRPAQLNSNPFSGNLRRSGKAITD